MATTTLQPVSPWRRIPLNMALALLNAYGASVTIFLVARVLVGERWQIIALFNSGAHLLLLPSILLLPLAVLLRRVATIALVTPPLVAFLLSYAVMFMPRNVPTVAAGEPLAVLTYNLKSQADDLDAALDTIFDADADVVALQELSQPMADALATALADAYPYQAHHAMPGNPIPGQGLLSRYPIVTDAYWRVNLAMQRVTLDVAGTTVALYNAHPPQPISQNGFAMRAEDTSDLLARAGRETGPVILMGDFNMSDQSEDYGRLSAVYQDAYHAAGWGMGFTFPATVPYFGGGRYAPSFFSLVPPLIRLDYVFHNSAFTTVDAQVWPESGGSDHLPLYVELVLHG